MVRRGEFYWLDWNPARGSEQAGRRPGLIVQNDVGNELAPTTIVASVTSASVRHYRFTVRVSASETGLPRDSTIDCAQLLTIDKERLRELCGRLPPNRIPDVDAALKHSLQLE